MAKNTVYIISGGVNYYLSGGAATQTVYAGSGTPWTAESTTPYELGYANDSYAPSAALGQLVTSEGGWGAEVVAVGYSFVTERIGVQMRGTTHDNAVILLRQLRQVLTTSRRSYPPLLAVTSGTNTVFFEVLWADVQETPDYLSEPTGLIRATITLTRTPWGMPSALTTLINAATFTANGTEQSLGTPAGEAIHEGSPINLTITGGQLNDVGGTSGPRRIWMAVVADAVVSSGLSRNLATSSTTTSNDNLDYEVTLQSLHGLHTRFLVRLTGPSTNLELRYSAYVGVTSSHTAWAKGPWVRPDVTTSTIIDLGPLYLQPGLLNYLSGTSAPVVGFDVDYRSGNGAAATGTIESAYILQAYTFARMDSPNIAHGGNSLTGYIINQTVVRDGAARFLSPPQAGLIINATGEMLLPMVLRGTLPRAYSGSSLWLQWQRTNTNHSASDTVTVTAAHAPLYRTIRGGTG